MKTSSTRSICILKLASMFLMGLSFLIVSLRLEAGVCTDPPSWVYASSSNGGVTNRQINAFVNNFNVNYSNAAQAGYSCLGFVAFTNNEWATYIANLAVLAGHTTSINTLSTNVSGLSTSVNANTTDINTLKTDVATLKSSSSTTSQNSSTIDYVSAAQFWALAFASVVSLWFVSRMSGAIIDAIRRF